MSKAQVIDYIEEVKKLTPIVQEQINLLEQFSKQHAVAYKALPSEYLKQQREQLALEKENEKLKQEAIKTNERLEVLNQQSIKTKQQDLIREQRATDLKRKAIQLSGAERREMEALERARERKSRQQEKELSSYQKLSAQRLQAQKTLKDLAVSQGANAKETKKARIEFEKLDKQIKLVDSISRDYSRNVGNYTSAITGNFSKIAGAFGIGAGFATGVLAIRDAIRIMRDYEKEIVNLGAIAGVPRKELEGLEKVIRDTAKSSLNTSNDIAIMATELVKLGSSIEETADLIPSVNSLSIALQATAEEAGTLLKSTLNAFGESSKEAGRYADVIAGMANKSALDFGKIRDSLTYVSAVAKTFNFTIEETGAMLGVLVDRGIKAETAGRILRSMLLNANKAGMTFNEALEKVKNSADQANTALNLFGKEGTSLALILANNQEEVIKLTKELENSRGELKKLTDLQLTSLDAKIKILKSSWEEFILSMDNGNGILAKSFKWVIEQANEVIGTLTKMTKSREDVLGEQRERQSANIVNHIKKEIDTYVAGRKKMIEANGEVYTAEIEAMDRISAKEKRIQWTRERHADELVNVQKQLDNFGGIYTDSDKKRLDALGNRKNQLINELIGLQKLANEVEEPLTKVEGTKTNEEETEAQKKARERARLQAEKEAEERAKLDFQIRQTELSNRIEQNKRVAELNASSADELIVIQTDYLMAKLELLELEYQEEIRLAGGNEQKLELARIKHNEAMLKLTDEATKLTVEANKKMYNDIDKKAEEANKEAEKKALEKLELIKKHLQEYTDLTKFGFGSLNTFFNGEFDKLLDAAKGTSAEIAVYANVIGDVMKDMYSALTASSDAYFTQQFENLEKEKELAIKFAGENTAGREAIEQQYEEKKRAIQRQQAKQQKETAIFNAMINIAQGVTSALAQAPPASFILAGLVGALGAIQIGTIASTPLPQYYTGTDNAKEGWAWTQERGAEVITDKKGNIKTMGHNKGATLTMMSAGDKVYKNHDEFFKAQEQDFNQDLNDVLMSSGIAPILKVENNGISKEEMLEVLSQTLGKQPKNSLNIDEKGFNLYNEKQNARQLNRNRNVRI